MKSKKPKIGKWAPEELTTRWIAFLDGNRLEKFIELSPDQAARDSHYCELWLLHKFITYPDMERVWRSIKGYSKVYADRNQDVCLNYFLWAYMAFRVGTDAELLPQGDREKLYGDIIKKTNELHLLVRRAGLDKYRLSYKLPAAQVVERRGHGYIDIHLFFEALVEQAKSLTFNNSYIQSHRGDPAHVRFQRKLSFELKRNLGVWLDEVVACTASVIFESDFTEANVRANRAKLV